MTALALGGERSAALAQYESCRRVLAGELGVEPDEETTVLYEQIKAGKRRGVSMSQSAALSSTPTADHTIAPAISEIPRHNLPAQLTAFVGRKTDLDTIAARLHDPVCHLLTIVGSGGMGKTRLAIQAAQTILDSAMTTQAKPPLADGLFFVALANVDVPDLLVSAIALALDFTFYGNGDSKTQLLDYLRNKAMLLVLDNCEHLLDGIDLISDLLAAAPMLKVLATSREPLNLREEWLYPLTGMSFPIDSAIDSATGIDLADYTAVQLFIQCAHRMQPGFDPMVEIRTIAQICCLVEGMPLGIELAATWLKFYTCDQIVREMERNLDFLATSLRNVPARHRSIRAVFASSWALLTEVERLVLSKLALFRGGFYQPAAEVVAGALRPVLVGLMDKSLLRVTPTSRYFMHELLRQFAEEKLLVTPVLYATTRESHCHYYLTQLEQLEQALNKQSSTAVFSTADDEIGNLRLAWTWAVEQHKIEWIEQSIDGLYLFYQIRSQFHEGEVAFAQAALRLRMCDDSQTTAVLGKVLARRGRFCFQLGRYEFAKQFLQEGLATAQQFSAQEEQAFCLTSLGDILSQQGQIAEAQQCYQISLKLYQTLDEPAGIAQCLNGLGILTRGSGNFTQAEQYLQQSLALSRAGGRADEIAFSLDALGVHTMMSGDYAVSVLYYREALAVFRMIGDQFGIARALQGLGMIAWGYGGTELTAAKQYLLESLAISREIGHRHQVATSLYFLGHIACRLEEYKEASQYAYEALGLATELNTPQLAAQAMLILGNTAWGVGDFHRAQQELHRALQLANEGQSTITVLRILVTWATLFVKESELAQNWSFPAEKALAVELIGQVLHHSASTRITKDDATRLLAHLTAGGPAAAIAAAQARGQAQALDEIVANLLAQSQVTNSHRHK